MKVTSVLVLALVAISAVVADELWLGDDVLNADVGDDSDVDGMGLWPLGADDELHEGINDDVSDVTDDRFEEESNTPATTKLSSTPGTLISPAVSDSEPAESSNAVTTDMTECPLKTGCPASAPKALSGLIVTPKEDQTPVISNDATQQLSDDVVVTSSTTSPHTKDVVSKDIAGQVSPVIDEAAPATAELPVNVEEEEKEEEEKEEALEEKEEKEEEEAITKETTAATPEAKTTETDAEIERMTDEEATKIAKNIANDLKESLGADATVTTPMAEPKDEEVTEEEASKSPAAVLKKLLKLV